MDTLVALSNIGAFLLQAVTLGTGVRDNTISIQAILRNAHELLEDAMDDLLDWEHLMDADESSHLYEKFDILSDTVQHQAEVATSQNGFLIAAHSYRAAKAEAKRQWALCYDLKTAIKKASQSARRAHGKGDGNTAKNAGKDETKVAKKTKGKKVESLANVLVPPLARIREHRQRLRNGGSGPDPFQDQDVHFSSTSSLVQVCT
ncbi:hypothetical protein Hypma_007490 [Hypsizygus marmoreus]|uniref:Fungal N-terminal domain-containing protein n=1 Tax=Hypsizygus marmoreus TaxID=39966 RepID=A0A369K161_HYPMA|nr:hypothetical protein Hypma_007490 [Hypsizygus marmoreus]